MPILALLLTLCIMRKLKYSVIFVQGKIIHRNGDSNFFIVIFSLNTLFHLVMNSKTIMKQDG